MRSTSWWFPLTPQLHYTTIMFCSLLAPFSLKSSWCSSPVANKPLNLVSLGYVPWLCFTELWGNEFRVSSTFLVIREPVKQVISVWQTMHMVKFFNIPGMKWAKLPHRFGRLANILKMKCFWALPQKWNLVLVYPHFFLEQVQQCWSCTKEPLNAGCLTSLLRPWPRNATPQILFSPFRQQ